MSTAQATYETEAEIIARATVKDVERYFSQGELFADDSIESGIRADLQHRKNGEFVLRTKELYDFRYRVALKGAGWLDEEFPDFSNLAWDEVNEEVVQSILSEERDYLGYDVPFIGWHVLSEDELQKVFVHDYENLSGLIEAGFSFDRSISDKAIK